MSDRSKIEWTDATWTVVQGCDYESPGCTNCYAVLVVNRLAHNPNPKISLPLAGLVEGRGGRLRWTGKVACREDRLDWPARWKRPRMVFIPSHGDLFHEDIPAGYIDRVFAVMEAHPRHTYQVLTKRAGRMRDYAAARYAGGAPSHVWLGVSVEDQKRADERIPPLLRTPAGVRFLSCEPLLAPLRLWPEWLAGGLGCASWGGSPIPSAAGRGPATSNGFVPWSVSAGPLPSRRSSSKLAHAPWGLRPGTARARTRPSGPPTCACGNTPPLPDLPGSPDLFPPNEEG
jgi:protein gp37